MKPLAVFLSLVLPCICLADTKEFAGKLTVTYPGEKWSVDVSPGAGGQHGVRLTRPDGTRLMVALFQTAQMPGPMATVLTDAKDRASMMKGLANIKDSSNVVISLIKTVQVFGLPAYEVAGTNHLNPGQQHVRAVVVPHGTDAILLLAMSNAADPMTVPDIQEIWDSIKIVPLPPGSAPLALPTVSSSFDPTRAALFSGVRGEIAYDTTIYLRLDSREQTELKKVFQATLSQVRAAFDATAKVTPKTNGVVIEYTLRDSLLQSLKDDFDAAIISVMDADSRPRYATLDKSRLMAGTMLRFGDNSLDTGTNDFVAFAKNLVGLREETLTVDVTWNGTGKSTLYDVSFTYAKGSNWFGGGSPDIILDSFYVNPVRMQRPDIVNERRTALVNSTFTPK